MQTQFFISVSQPSHFQLVQDIAQMEVNTFLFTLPYLIETLVTEHAQDDRSSAEFKMLSKKGGIHPGAIRCCSPEEFEILGFPWSKSAFPHPQNFKMFPPEPQKSLPQKSV